MDPIAHRVASRHAAIVPKVDIPSVMVLIDELKALLQKCRHWLTGSDKAFKDGAEESPPGYVFPGQMRSWVDALDALRESAEELSKKAWLHDASSGAGVVSEALDFVVNCCKEINDNDRGALHPMRMFGKTDHGSSRGSNVPYESRKDSFVKAFMSFLNRADPALKKAVSQVKAFEARQKKMPGYRA